MARIPTANDLGRVSLRPATGAPTVDISPTIRANQQLDDSINRVGAAFSQAADDQDRLAFGKAQSDLIKGQMQLQSSFEHDNDYSTIQQRYGDQTSKLTGDLAGQIGSPRLREEFNNWAGMQNARGQEQIRGLAWNKEKDANVAGLTQTLQDNSNLYMTSGDDEAREQLAGATRNLIDGAVSKGYLSATQGQQLGRSWAVDTAKGSISLLPPSQRIQALQSNNGLVSFIPPDQRQELLKNSAFEATELKLADLKQPNDDGSTNLDSLSASTAALTNAIFQQESGNKHRNADGSLVTSPRGAQGVGQIMPPTGQDPGFGVAPLQNDSEQENRRFTGDYLGAMLKRYGGNQVLALAAYNAGPGKVDEWIKQIGDPRNGQVTNQQFASSIPVSETRNYVYQVADKATKGAAYQAIIDSPDFMMMNPQHQLQVTSAIASMRNQDATLAIRRENAAASAANSMQIRIANAEIPTSNDWNSYSKAVAGTSYDGTTDTLQAITASTQHLFSLPPAQAQAEVDQMMVSLRQNGGNDTQYKVLNALQSNLSQRRTDLQKNPQQVYSLDSGHPLQPLAVDDAINQPAVWGQGLVQRQVNSDAIEQKYGPTAGKNLLTTDELHNAQDAYARMSGDQRVQFWRNTQASSSPEIASRLAREVGGDSLQVAAVAGLANTPDGYSAAMAVDKGSRLLNPVDGAAKIKLSPTFDDETTQAIKSEYPGLSTSQIQQILPVVKAFHVGSGGDPQRSPNDDSLHKIIGSPVKISGSPVIAPPGTDANAYRDSINAGISGLGSYAQSVRNGLSDGVYALTPDVDGNQVLINKASQRRVVGDDGRPVVIKVSK